MSAFGTPFVEAALPCGNCRATMQRLTLPGHYGMPVELDVCAACHLVWFDTTETARLGGPALLTLIGRMAQAQSLAHEVLRPDGACPRCRRCRSSSPAWTEELAIRFAYKRPEPGPPARSWCWAR